MLVLCLFGLECNAISARELPVLITAQTDLTDLAQYDTDGDGLIAAIVIGSEPSENSGGIRPMSSVGDNGVRLRSAPNTSATVLELMYEGEYVFVDLNKNIAGWYYLQRFKTGTWGYASSLYIYA